MEEKKSIKERIKENKKEIIKKALIVGGVITGIIIGAKILSDNREEDEFSDVDLLEDNSDADLIAESEKETE